MDAAPTDIESEGAHIIKRSLAKEDGSVTGIVSISPICRYHFMTSNPDTFPVCLSDLGYNPPLR